MTRSWFEMPTPSNPTSVQIVAGRARLPGELALPMQPRGVVLFAYGSGSSRLSPRNLYVARILREGGMGTLLFDLLTPAEDRAFETRIAIARSGM
jgi:hypothetical protein